MITVITPTIPERGKMLAEAIDSVCEQEFLPDDHRVGVDIRREGPAVVRNRLLSGVQTEWVAFLDDDDLMLANHLSTLIERAYGSEHDVLYSRGRIEERDDWDPWREFDADRLRIYNYIPVTTLVRYEALMGVGGFPLNEEFEDWALWKKLIAEGANFCAVDVTTWVYRRSENSRSWA